MTSTMSRWYSTTELYPYPKDNLLIEVINEQKPKKSRNYIFIIPEQLKARPSFHTITITEIVEKS